MGDMWTGWVMRRVGRFGGVGAGAVGWIAFTGSDTEDDWTATACITVLRTVVTVE